MASGPSESISIRKRQTLPSTEIGYKVIAGSLVFFVCASYAVFFSAFVPTTGNFLIDFIAQDTHYKYLVLFLIPTTSYFVIANWVGWQYYRNS